MNSTTMADKTQREEAFRDYIFTTKFLDTLQLLVKKPEKFMLSIGFKLPHLALHVPYKYYAMYKNNKTAAGAEYAWKLTKKEIRYPPTSPAVAYRCCAMPRFMYMEEDGAKPHTKVRKLGDISIPLSERMRNELMLGYAAAITFLDVQLGRILDEMDKLKLWDTTTLVLTADHGMHNGEKGIWEKWSMFDESTR
jgi:iduronate 2-sulfatase